MYPSAWPVSARWVSSRILNSTRTAIGSQCNVTSSGIAWIYFMVPSIRRAAQFCTFWSHCICFRGSGYSSALPTSSLLVTNACVTCSVAAAVRYRLILEMLRRWNIADWHKAVTSSQYQTGHQNYKHCESPWPNSHPHATLAAWASLAVELNRILLLLFLSRSTSRSLFSSISWFLLHTVQCTQQPLTGFHCDVNVRVISIKMWYQVVVPNNFR